jgi:hypothetical protein
MLSISWDFRLLTNCILETQDKLELRTYRPVQFMTVDNFSASFNPCRSRTVKCSDGSSDSASTSQKSNPAYFENIADNHQMTFPDRKINLNDSPLSRFNSWSLTIFRSVSIRIDHEPENVLAALRIFSQHPHSQIRKGFINHMKMHCRLQIQNLEQEAIFRPACALM